MVEIHTEIPLRCWVENAGNMADPPRSIREDVCPDGMNKCMKVEMHFQSQRDFKYDCNFFYKFLNFFFI